MTYYLYLIGREDGPVKIGYTGSPQTRLVALQSGCPFTIHVLYSAIMRNRDHALWHEGCIKFVHPEKHLRGEWFDISADEAIECINTSLEAEAAFEDRGQ